MTATTNPQYKHTERKRKREKEKKRKEGLPLFSMVKKMKFCVIS
jgi:hypothetical protein